MTKIETNFEKLNHYQDIETYYPPLDDIKDFLYELFEDRVESQKYIVRTNQKLEQLQSNWNSLREWLEDKLSELYQLKGPKNERISQQIIQDILEKMSELEVGDSNN